MVPRLDAPCIGSNSRRGFFKGCDGLSILFEYFVVFVAVFIMNYFMFIRGKKEYNKNKIPTELLYLKKVYHVDVSKIDYGKFVVTYSLINTFIIATIYIIIMYLVDTMIFKLIIGAILLILMIIICYGFLAKYYLWKERDR